VDRRIGHLHFGSRWWRPAVDVRAGTAMAWRAVTDLCARCCMLPVLSPGDGVLAVARSPELLAISLFRCLLRFCAQGRGTSFGGRPFPLGLVPGSGWLTNAAAAVMIHYSMSLL